MSPDPVTFRKQWSTYGIFDRLLLLLLVLREKSDMERQLTKMHKDLEVSNRELSEKTLQLSQLRKRTYRLFIIFFRRKIIIFSVISNEFIYGSAVSEAMYKEYDQLKQQYDLETGTLHKAMERASQVSNWKY